MENNGQKILIMIELSCTLFHTSILILLGYQSKIYCNFIDTVCRSWRFTKFKQEDIKFATQNSRIWHVMAQICLAVVRFHGPIVRLEGWEENDSRVARWGCVLHMLNCTHTRSREAKGSKHACPTCSTTRTTTTPSCCFSTIFGFNKEDQVWKAHYGKQARNKSHKLTCSLSVVGRLWRIFPACWGSLRGKNISMQGVSRKLGSCISWG